MVKVGIPIFMRRWHSPGIDVNVGDYLLAINGKKLTSDINPYSLLEQTADREITIKVGTTTDMTIGQGDLGKTCEQ